MHSSLKLENRAHDVSEGMKTMVIGSRDERDGPGMCVSGCLHHCSPGSQISILPHVLRHIELECRRGGRKAKRENGFEQSSNHCTVIHMCVPVSFLPSLASLSLSLSLSLCIFLFSLVSRIRILRIVFVFSSTTLFYSSSSSYSGFRQSQVRFLPLPLDRRNEVDNKSLKDSRRRRKKNNKRVGELEEIKGIAMFRKKMLRRRTKMNQSSRIEKSHFLWVLF